MPPVNRLTFLYPRLARALREAEPLARTRPSLVSQPAANRRHTTNTRRHGKAVQFKSAKDAEANQAKETTTAAAEPPTAEQEPSAEDPPAKGPSHVTTAPAADGTSPAQAAEEAKRAEEEVQEVKSEAKKSGPMETVLYMNGPPGSIASVKAHPPLPFSHFFDSYAMVNRLVEAGYERPQSVTMMKAMRGLLRDKMTAAQEDLVSKSDVDNVRQAFPPPFPPFQVVLATRQRANSLLPKRAGDVSIQGRLLGTQHRSQE